MCCSPHGNSDIMYKVKTGFLFPLQRTTYDPITVGCPTTLKFYPKYFETILPFQLKKLHNQFTPLFIGELLFLWKLFQMCGHVICNFSLEICLKNKMFPPC